MENTLIVKNNKTEIVRKNLRFRVLRTTVNKARYDSFIHDSYSQAKDRINLLKEVFKGDWRYDIIIVE